MLKSLQLTSFKSFDHISVDFNRLNLLLGLNSSGKSSIIQAIRMLDNVANGKIGEEVLLNGHGTLEELENKDAVKGTLRLEIIFGEDGPCERVCFPEINAESNHVLKFPKIAFVCADRFGPQDYIPVNYTHEIGEHGENMLNLLDEIRDMHMPEKMQHPKSEKVTVEANIEKWLQEISPDTKFTFGRPDRTDVSFAHFNNFRSKNVGFGLSYILPVIVALTYGAIKGDFVVMIENPEAHLHPKGQTKIGEFICRAVQSGTQVFVETHSDHLFDGIRIFAKNNGDTMFSDNVSINWCKIDDGITKIYNPTLLNDGRIKSWPKDMFDQFEINAMELM